MTDSSDFHFSELSENKKDLVVESWHYVESHLAEVKSRHLKLFVQYRSQNSKSNYYQFDLQFIIIFVQFTGWHSSLYGLIQSVSRDKENFRISS